MKFWMTEYEFFVFSIIFGQQPNQTNIPKNHYRDSLEIVQKKFPFRNSSTMLATKEKEYSANISRKILLKSINFFFFWKQKTKKQNVNIVYLKKFLWNEISHRFLPIHCSLFVYLLFLLFAEKKQQKQKKSIKPHWIREKI